MIYFILFAHWLNDFVGQSYLFPTLEVGKNKSKDWNILGIHICLYTWGMTLCLWPFFGFETALVYVSMNGLTHLVIDAITSRITSWAWSRGDHKLFWSTIGFDQFLHVAILCATLPAV